MKGVRTGLQPCRNGTSITSTITSTITITILKTTLGSFTGDQGAKRRGEGEGCVYEGGAGGVGALSLLRQAIKSNIVALIVDKDNYDHGSKEAREAGGKEERVHQSEEE